MSLRTVSLGVKDGLRLTLFVPFLIYLALMDSEYGSLSEKVSSQ